MIGVELQIEQQLDEVRTKAREKESKWRQDNTTLEKKLEEMTVIVNKMVEEQKESEAAHKTQEEDLRRRSLCLLRAPSVDPVNPCLDLIFCTYIV